ncbi:MAG: Mur ligase family protein [Acidimicrobiales bacterium]|jgi:dihydrofolate synthase/folylpolyglutamate synthase|nr:Mur ligase family protein [Acidimicrobiales bacterium]MDP6323486.1 Mur ligase family protein [Acidimicrobiales bacterium]HJL91028.1 Mur ligase family protein [Acidimicrobiales bacterium]HJO41363.1 Mur ligase family protein [Acidimicrobiales bacterium]
MNFREALQYLDRFINREATAGRIHGLSLAAMSELVECMGEPHKDLRTIHVTGTNGKGSVVSMTESLLSSKGLRVGSYMSPHVDTIRERFTLAGSQITEEIFSEIIFDVSQYVESHELEPSYFELLTAAAILLFSNEGVDAAVVEVGILGRFDATNVLEGEVAVITNIGKDHTDGSEGWRRSIAAEKAGIIVKGKPLLLGNPEEDVFDLFEVENPDPIFQYGKDFSVEDSLPAVGGQVINVKGIFGQYEEIFLPLYGNRQAENAALSLATAEVFLEGPIPEEVVESAFGELVIPGRLEILSRRPVILVDGAHNKDSANHLAETINDVFPESRRILILGTLEPHSPEEIFTELKTISPELVIVCAAPSPRAINPNELEKVAMRLGLEVERAENPYEATLKALRIGDEEDLIVAAGSFYNISEVRRAVEDFQHTTSEI